MTHLPHISIIQITTELWGAFFLLICSFIAFLEYHKERRNNRSKAIFLILITVIVLLCSDTLAIFYRGNTSLTGYIMVRITNFLVFANTPVLVMLITRYLQALVENSDYSTHPLWFHIIHFIGVVYFFIIVISQFTNLLYYFDEDNLYHRQPYYAIVAVLAMVLMLILIVLIIVHHRRLSRYEVLALLAYTLLPFASNIFQAFHYGLSLNNIAILISTLAIFFTHQYENFSRMVRQKHLIMEQEMNLAAHKAELADHQAELAVHKAELADHQAELAVHKAELAEKEMALAKTETELARKETKLARTETELARKDAELSSRKLQMSLSQMKPHFIFNSLNIIEYLCTTDPERAAMATGQFARYLRANLDSLDKDGMIPFSKELKHIHSYVWLEDMRFEEDLCYYEELEVTDFQIPALTVQPLIENAIKHGIKTSRDGVITVTLATLLTDDAIEIIVQDDGGGFDVSKLNFQDSEHIGLSNVKTRLAMLVDGSLDIRSGIGEGTTVTMRIPRR